MIPRNPAVTYLIAYYVVRMRGEDPSSAELPPRPDKVEIWELRAALSIILEEMRMEFALSSQAICDPGLRKRLDADMDEALTRVEAAADRI